jgi:2',3'-cyclic-nucleotide 2'-phosphodiesterase/3'-nucleotidase
MLLKNPKGQDVLLMQPNRWGSHLGQVDLSIVSQDGHWVVESKDSRLLAVDSSLVEDAQVVQLTQSYHQTTLTYVGERIGSTLAPFPGGPPARYVDNALADLINTIQEHTAEENGHPVDLSLAALFSDVGSLPAGDVTLRDAYSIYIYDNTLYVMEINGSILRRALELDAQYFARWNTSSPPDATMPQQAKSPNVQDYNWDLYSKIDYAFDLTQPAGSRLTRLKFNGQDVTDTQVFRIAINNYRASGGGGYSMFKEGTVLWTSADGVRDYIARYIQAHPNLDPATENTCNFSLSPDLYAYFFSASRGPTKCSGP